jgi:hypothetical protein
MHMTSNDDTPKESGSGQNGEGEAGGHSDAGFKQLGGEPTVDPGATDTGIGGTGGVDGATLGGLDREVAPHIVPPEGSER